MILERLVQLDCGRGCGWGWEVRTDKGQESPYIGILIETLFYIMPIY
jgi:hypothetical protein